MYLLLNVSATLSIARSERPGRLAADRDRQLRYLGMWRRRFGGGSPARRARASCYRLRVSRPVRSGSRRRRGGRRKRTDPAIDVFRRMGGRRRGPEATSRGAARRSRRVRRSRRRHTSRARSSRADTRVRWRSRPPRRVFGGTAPSGVRAAGLDTVRTPILGRLPSPVCARRTVRRARPADARRSRLRANPPSRRPCH